MKKDLENPIKLENGRMNPTLFTRPQLYFVHPKLYA